MFSRRFLFVLAALAAVAFPALGRAAKVKVWHPYLPTHYEKAKFKQAVISNEGALRLSRQLKPLADLNAMHVWDVVEDRDGNLLVATGDEGKLFKVTPDGKVSLLYKSDDSQILCLALSPSGNLYAGTGPNGLILRIDPQGNARVLHDTPELYVWSLTFDAKKETLYAGTGPKGRIYRVTSDGKAEIFYATKQEHILSLAADNDGFLYAGTDKHGLVYRIDARAKAFVLFQAPQAEIRALIATPDGLYAGTSAASRRRFGSGSGSSSSGGPNPLPAAGNAKTEVKKPENTAPGAQRQAIDSASRPFDREPERSGGASPIAPPATGDNSVYRIRPDGTVREIFRDKVLILSLLRDHGRLFAGTGMDGQLFEINEANKERSELARLDHGQIQCLRRRHDGAIVAGAGDPAKLYLLRDDFAAKGTIVSDVLDAKIISAWGAVQWQADTPAGTGVSLAVRSGNVAEPDDTWSDWSAEQSDPKQAIVAAPAARFLQYRVTLTSDNPKDTPVLRDLTLRYKTTNLAPEVSGIDVPDLESGSLENPKKLRFRWTATDQNEDELTYSVAIRKEGWKQWVQLEENLEKREFEWDTTTTPPGIYRLKIVASDRKDNAEEDALAGERISAPFAVAHEPPAVTVRLTSMEGDQAMIEATASDPLVRLTTASFAVNGKKWTNVFPTDGLFDSKKETFKFKTESLKPGTYVLVLRVKDAAGNVGSGDLVFTVPGR